MRGLASPGRTIYPAHAYFACPAPATVALPLGLAEKVKRCGVGRRREPNIQPFLLRSDKGLVFTCFSYATLVRSYNLRRELIDRNLI